MRPIEKNFFDDIRIDENYNIFAIDRVNGYEICLPEETCISSGSNNDLQGNCKVTINLLDSGRSIDYRTIFPSLKEADTYAKELIKMMTKASDSKNSVR